MRTMLLQSWWIFVASACTGSVYDNVSQYAKVDMGMSPSLFLMINGAQAPVGFQCTESCFHFGKRIIDIQIVFSSFSFREVCKK
jgi:hypothetical protein